MEASKNKNKSPWMSREINETDFITIIIYKFNNNKHQSRNHSIAVAAENEYPRCSNDTVCITDLQGIIRR